MTNKLSNPRTKIYMCYVSLLERFNRWYTGAAERSMLRIFLFNPNEKQTCYKHHFIREAWTSCTGWE